jgi:dienelactone hydrolase
VRISPAGLEGLLRLPSAAKAMVVFAHGSGSSRFSPRNNHVADALGERGQGTLLFDLLTDDEALDRANVFDIELLAERLLMAVNWLAEREDTRDLPIGLFGSSTGAAAALVAAASSDRVGAIVSRGGRPDLAAPVLSRVKAPTLLIVGSLDTDVLMLNRLALAELSCEKDLQIVSGATHLFEEPGTLDTVCALTGQWFEDHLRRHREV